MNKAVPWLVGLGLTAVSAVGAVGVNTALERALAIPGGAAAPAPVAAPVESGVAEARPAPAPRPAATLSKRKYVEDILARNIFDHDAIGRALPGTSASSGGSGDDDGEAPLTDLNVQLIGTIVAVPERYSSALISAEGKLGRGYGIGDKLFDAEVIKIEHDRVTIRRGSGEIEVIAFKPDAVPKPTATAAATGNDTDGVSQISETKFVIERGVVDRYITDLDAISRMGRAIPHRGPDGQIDGYRLSGIRRDSIGQTLGIKNGDIVHAVNGQPLTSMQGAMAAYQALQSEASFNFEVTRRGQKVTMEYEVR